MNPKSKTIDRHANEESADQQALLDAVLHGSDQLLAESLRSEERRRRRRRRTTWCVLLGGVVMSVIVMAWAAGWFLALSVPDAATADGKAGGEARVAPAVVDRQEAVEQAEALEKEGWALWQQHKFADAAVNFEQALELDPVAANAWNGLGWAQFNSGDDEAAKTAFQRCLEIDLSHPGGLNGLGQLYLSWRDYKKAEPYLKKAALKAPAAWYGLGRLYLLTGKYPAAATWLKKAAKDQPTDATLQAMIAAADAKKLTDDLRKQIEPASREKSPEARRGWVLFNEGKMRSAESMFRQALAKDPENLAAMNGLGFCLLNMGKPSEAQPYFEKYLEVEKDAAGPMNGLARCLQADGKEEEAVKIWERMQKKYPGPNAATYALAAVYTDRGEHVKAVKMYQLLAKAEPENAELKAKLAAAQKASKEGADKQK